MPGRAWLRSHSARHGPSRIQVTTPAFAKDSISHPGGMDAPQLPLWWSWLWWPTTLLTGGAGSALYLYIASIGLDVRRRVVVALAGAGLSVVIGGLFFVTASNIYASPRGSR
jgi:hypothetical protein